MFLKDQLDDDMKKIGLQIIKNNPNRLDSDNVFSMLRDMANPKWEKNILLPLLEEIERHYEGGDKFQYWLQLFDDESFAIDFHPNRILYRVGGCGTARLITELVLLLLRFFRIQTGLSHQNENDAVNDFIKYYIYFCNLAENESQGGLINMETAKIIQDAEACRLFRETWLGKHITYISTLREELEKKYAPVEKDDFFTRGI